MIPDIGGDYLQEPSETDRRGVRDDVNLKGDGYLGEFVIARQVIYLVSPTGEIAEVGTTDELLIR